ncbi:MAG: hypothetical protein HY858_08485 [Candidatus Solibacter usitatus]|nr:hypothetical protein [Candidatus Solibacter usitatus]
MAIDRQHLHQLLDELPESELWKVRLALCPSDDEPVTDQEAAALLRAEEEVRSGRVVSHEDVLKEFGLA